MLAMTNETLVSRRIDLRDVRIISNLNYNQSASIRVDDMTSENIEIQRGFPQTLSPALCNLYSEDIMNKSLNDLDMGIKINSMTINNVRYADDTVLTAGTQEDLQMLLDRMVTVSEEYVLSLNINKINYMLISKSP